MSGEAFGGPVLLLTEADVDRLLPMEDALREVEGALRDLGEGRAQNRPRQRVRAAHAILNLMPAAWPGRGYFGYKEYTVSRDGARFWFHLFDGTTGEALALMQANRLGQRRTGAASGIATKFLARHDASRLGIVGTGWQAESQVEAICRVRRIEDVRCFSPHSARRQGFAEKMGERVGVDVRAAASAEDAVRGADVVVAATDSSSPVILGEWLGPGVHMNAMGANRLDARELDDEAIRRSTFFAVDSVEQAKMESGDLTQPVAAGLLRWDAVHEIASVVSGAVQARTRPTDVTLFKSLGLALEDVAVGAFIYERARKEGMGNEVRV